MTNDNPGESIVEPPYYPLPQDPNYVVPESTDELQRIVEPPIEDKDAPRVNPAGAWKEISLSNG